MSEDKDQSVFYKAAKAMRAPDLTIEIDGRSIELTARFLVSDIMYVEEQSSEASTATCHDQIVHIMQCHLVDDDVPLSDLYRVSEEDIDRFVSIYIKSDDKLLAKYNALEGDAEYRFIAAIKEASREYSEATAKVLKKALVNTMPPMDGVVAALHQMDGVLDTINACSSALQEAVRPVVTRIGGVLDSFRLNNPVYNDAFRKLAESLDNLIRIVPAINISEERARELKEAYEQWGIYGWTLPIDSIDRLFYKKPANAEEANKIMSAFTHKAQMLELFEVMREQKHTCKPDLEEAIANFADKRYKSCAMILCSLIDARLIKAQGGAKEDDENCQRRKSARVAAKQLIGLIEAKELSNEFLFTYLNGINLFKAIITIYADGDDFKIQREVINRNFLDHGMSQKKVRRRDCAQLFLLLYNLNDYLDNYMLLIRPDYRAELKKKRYKKR